VLTGENGLSKTKPLYVMVGSAGIVIAWIELFWRHCL